MDTRVFGVVCAHCCTYCVLAKFFFAGTERKENELSKIVPIQKEKLRSKATDKNDAVNCVTNSVTTSTIVAGFLLPHLR